MFKRNDKHKQADLFGASAFLNPDKQERLENSSGGCFYRLIFCNIAEEDFAVLYSKKSSAPNAPINCMISALLLMQKHAWTYAQLFEQIDFNLETRMALGLRDLDTQPFTEPTLFNFKRRLNDYQIKTGENLFEQLFNRLTRQQAKELQLKTGIQRTDSVLLNSNIRSYSRLELVVEVLLRLYRHLSAQEQADYAGQLSDYIGQNGQQYVRRIKPGEQMAHLEKLGQLYHLLYTALHHRYQNNKAFSVFARVYEEHFSVLETPPDAAAGNGGKRIAVKPNEALGSGSLQSPDDTEATYREKNGEQYQGYVALVTETCHPDNPLQLITDISTQANHTDDAKLLHSRIDQLKDKTPDLEELHHDGGMGSAANDIKLEQQGITPIQTAIKGTTAKAPMTISCQPSAHTDTETTSSYTVQCANEQHPAVIADKPSKSHRAVFDLSICAKCPFYELCPTRSSRKHTKGIAVYRFTPEDYLRQQRHRNIATLPPERQKLRPNVEATIAQMRKGEKRTGKLPVRGLLNTSLYGIAMSIIINFGRIFRYQGVKSAKNSIFRLFLPSNFRELLTELFLQYTLSIFNCNIPISFLPNQPKLQRVF